MTQDTYIHPQTLTISSWMVCPFHCHLCIYSVQLHSLSCRYRSCCLCYLSPETIHRHHVSWLTGKLQCSRNKLSMKEVRVFLAKSMSSLFLFLILSLPVSGVKPPVLYKPPSIFILCVIAPWFCPHHSFFAFFWLHFLVKCQAINCLTKPNSCITSPGNSYPFILLVSPEKSPSVSETR